MKLLFLLAYFLIMIGIGIYSFLKIKSSKDFYVAGAKGGTGSITGSLLATILGSSAILGVVNSAYARGWAAAWLPLCGVVGLLALYPIAGQIRKFGKFTLPELLEDFYGKEAKMISSIIIPIAWIGIIAAQINGGAKILAGFPQTPKQACWLITGQVMCGS